MEIHLLASIVLMWIHHYVTVVNSATHTWGSSFTSEYCDHEVFSASCNAGETIIIGRAEYGHMSQGKCIEVDLGVFGCKSDVTAILSAECSGKPSCSLNVDDEALRETRPCSVGILVYLKATYFCVKANQDSEPCRPRKASRTPQFLPSSLAVQSLCPASTGLFDQEFALTANPGQHITFTLIDLSVLDPMTASQRYEVEELGYILDTGSDKVFPVMQSRREESTLEDSQTNTVSIALSSQILTPFMIKFRAVGCSDLQLPADVWVTREGNGAVVGCHETPQTWSLQCIHSHWAGVIGNCSLPPEPKPVVMSNVEYKLPLPKDIIIVIIGCSTFFLAVVTVTLGYVCLKWPKTPVRKEEPVTTLRYGDVRHTRIPSTSETYMSDTYLTPQYIPDDQPPGEYQPIWSKPLPTPPGLARSNSRATVPVRSPCVPPKRNNEDVYNMSLASGDNTDKRKYYILDKDLVQQHRNDVSNV